MSVESIVDSETTQQNDFETSMTHLEKKSNFHGRSVNEAQVNQQIEEIVEDIIDDVLLNHTNSDVRPLNAYFRQTSEISIKNIPIILETFDIFQNQRPRISIIEVTTYPGDKSHVENPKDADAEGTLFLQHDGHQPKIILCGQKVSGTASISGSADNKGNKQVEAKVEAKGKDTKASISGSIDNKGHKEAGAKIETKSKDGKFSASASGSVSKDKEGKVNGKVEMGAEINF
jgi:hypothetical protein